jgi:hypothetical protein
MDDTVCARPTRSALLLKHVSDQPRLSQILLWQTLIGTDDLARPVSFQICSIRIRAIHLSIYVRLHIQTEKDKPIQYFNLDDVREHVRDVCKHAFMHVCARAFACVCVCRRSSSATGVGLAGLHLQSHPRL